MQDKKFSVSDINHIYNELSDISGIDFSEYAFSFKMHRVLLFAENFNIPTLDDFVYKLNDSEVLASEFLKFIFVPQSEFFRDADFWNYLQSKLLPKLLLKKEVFVHFPECVGGEDFYSFMFFAGLFRSSHISVTVSFPVSDFENKIKSEVFEAKKIKACLKNIEALSGIRNPEDVFFGKENMFKINHLFRGNIFFECCDILKQQHISKFDLVMFRNRMIYYDKNMQDKVLKKVSVSLKKNGILVIGEKEKLNNSAGKFKHLQSNLSVYKKRFF